MMTQWSWLERDETASAPNRTTGLVGDSLDSKPANSEGPE
jgi:hypothetical protein